MSGPTIRSMKLLLAAAGLLAAVHQTSAQERRLSAEDFAREAIGRPIPGNGERTYVFRADGSYRETFSSYNRHTRRGGTTEVTGRYSLRPDGRVCLSDRLAADTCGPILGAEGLRYDGQPQRVDRLGHDQVREVTQREISISERWTRDLRTHVIAPLDIIVLQPDGRFTETRRSGSASAVFHGSYLIRPDGTLCLRLDGRDGEVCREVWRYGDFLYLQRGLIWSAAPPSHGDGPRAAA